MKFAKRIFLAFIVFSTAVFSAVSQKPASKIELDGIGSDVTVIRDDRSIPYIRAENDAELYFVQGYVTASDRLWQMDLFRRVARGETAEIFGKTTLEEDKQWRRYGFAKIAEESLKHLGPELRSALENYSRGVNAYINSLDSETIPVEFKVLKYEPRPWTPADTIVVGKILAEALSSTYEQDLLQMKLAGIEPNKFAELINPQNPLDLILYGSDKPKAKAARMAAVRTISDDSLRIAAEHLAVRKRSLERIGFYAERLAASNNWVISGKRTADGKAMLANDPHLLPNAPGIWYLTHLSTPEMRVAGVTFPGVPGIVLGHNEHIAWGATNVGPDVQDLYIEKFNDEGKYKTPDGLRTPEVRTEEIKVRTSVFKTDVTVEKMEVSVTRNGPVIIDSADSKIALKWTAFDPKNSEFEAFFLANRARNWDEFKAAFKGYGGPTQNFVYADTKGKIGWYAAGRVPIRRSGDGSVPYDGSTNNGDWIGHIPFEELPHLYDPPEGLIVTANQRIVGTDYKYPAFLRNFAAPWRARRIYDLLKDNRKVTMDDVRDVQHDVYNIPLTRLAKELVSIKALSAANTKALQDWDGKMTPDSYAALLVDQVRACAANKMAAANPPVPGWLIRERILENSVESRSRTWLPKEFADHSALFKACESEVEAMFAKTFGNDRTKWVWGRVAVSGFPHPLARAAFIGSQFATPNVPIAGSGQTPNVGSYVSMRHIASPGNWDATRFVIPLGQSGNPQSKHYTDQFEKWRTGEPAVFPFSAEAVEKAAVSKAVFTPAKTNAQAGQ